MAVASARFVSTRPATGGRGDWISKIMGALSIVLARRGSDLPRRVVVSVSDDRFSLLGRGRRELASWDRRHMRLSAEQRGRTWYLWVQPPGGHPGFELHARRGTAADSVMTALAEN